MCALLDCCKCAVRRVVGRDVLKCVEMIWCAVSLFSDKYFKIDCKHIILAQSGVLGNVDAVELNV